MVPKTNGNTQQVIDLTRRVQMLEEVFLPMAKTAMEIIAGKDGKPGMAEDMRNVSKTVGELLRSHQEELANTKNVRKEGFARIEQLEAWQKEVKEDKETEKEKTLLGMKVSAETRIAIINGIFILLGGVVGWLLK
jgi:hypothetical protein